MRGRILTAWRTKVGDDGELGSLWDLPLNLPLHHYRTH